MAESKPKAPQGNPALRMLGLPKLPTKLPSRNWMIFWTVSAGIAAAIIYDRREKKRATARWAHAVEHLGKVPLANAQAMPRKLTIFLASPPGDGLRTSQDYFTEYVKPVLAASGLDWEFVQGRRQGDVRAVVAERIRKTRRDSDAEPQAPGSDSLPTEDDFRTAFRREHGIVEYDGVRGDVVIGRHTWKEYVRGLHEGWLGPLTAPPEPEPLPSSPSESTGENSSTEEKPAEENEPKRPAQPKAYNTPSDYPSSILPLLIPAELGPSTPIPQHHILGFLNTPKRLVWFFNRRALADQIGREVAAACLCTYREFQELSAGDVAEESRCEQQRVLDSEEKNWVKSIWKEDEPTKDAAKDGEQLAKPVEKRDKTWVEPLVVDSRIGSRMRRFELQPEDEARARAIVVPEEEVEGIIKGSLRQLYRFGVKKFFKEEKKINLDDSEGSEGGGRA